MLVCSQAIALTQRAADHDYDLPLADFCGGCRAGGVAFAAEGGRIPVPAADGSVSPPVRGTGRGNQSKGVMPFDVR